MEWLSNLGTSDVLLILVIVCIGLSFLSHVRRTNELLEQINTKLFRLDKHFNPHFVDTRDD